MKSIKPALALVLLPLILALVGAWQWHRSDERTHADAERLVNLQTTRARFEAINARGNPPDVEVNGQRWPMSSVLYRLEKNESELRKLQPLLPWMTIAAILATVLGAVAAGLGMFGLVSTARAGAPRASAELLETFARLTRRLPRLLVAHVVVMSLALLAVLSFEALAIWHAGRMSRTEGKVFVVLVLLVLAVPYSLWKLRRHLRTLLHMFEPAPIAVLGEAVTSGQAPGLWSVVRTLAERQQALAPDHIVVGIDAGFFIVASDVQLVPAGTRLTGCTLHVPLAYLGLLDTDEIQAILGHELAHHAGEDITYTRRLLPLLDSVDRSLSALADTIADSSAVEAVTLRPAFLLGLHVRERFEHAIGAWRRERELIADAAGMRLSSPVAAGSALVRVASLQPEIDAELARHTASLFDTRSAPPGIDDLPARIIHDLAQRTPRLAADAMAVRAPHPCDTHPSNGERLAAMGIELDLAGPRGLRPVDAAQALQAMDRYFDDAPLLRARLTTAYLDEFRNADAAITQALRTVSGNIAGEVRLHEGARRRGIIGLALTFLFAAAGIAMLLLPWVQGDTKALELRLLGALLTAIALILLPWPLRLLRRAAPTALQLTPDHFTFHNLRAPLAIHHIQDAVLNITHGVRLELLLTDDAPPPEVTSRAFFSPAAVYDRKRRVVRLQLTQLCRDGRRLPETELVELLGGYLYAGNARRDLRGGS